MENRNTSSSSDLHNHIEEGSTSFYRTTTEYVESIDLPLISTGKSAAIATLRENREREKRELSQLNDRFASYIERVRFLERDNKKLQSEIDQLREKWGSQTHAIRDKYDIEIHDVRQLIDDTAKDRATAELRAKRAEEETLKIQEKCELLIAGRDSDRAKIQLLEQQLLTNQSDLNLFHRRLADLEDEQKRNHHESEKMNKELERITQDLDHETIVRIELENRKQTLEDEIHFLKKIHVEEIEELKQMNIIGTSLDPTHFFQNELITAVQQIRDEYEQLNQQQRTELQTWYQTKVVQAIEEIQSRRAIEKSENAREQEEIKNLRTTTVDLQQDMMAMRRRNKELENRVHELEELIQSERRNNNRANDERAQQIRELTYSLHDLERDYDELVATKTSLDSEISIYRKLLENEEKRENLKSIIDHVRVDSSQTSRSTSHPRSRQKTNDSQELGEQSINDANSDMGHDDSSKSEHDNENINERVPSTVHQESIRLRDSSESPDRSTDYDSSIEDPNERLNRFLSHRFEDHHSTLTCYTSSQSLFSTEKERTIFDQVYGSRPRRPTSIGLNTRWVPITNYGNTYTWHPSDIHSRRIKIRTCFDTAARRELPKPNAVTPPSSDYTDAYLSAFAPKSFSSRRIYRIAAPVFANVAPVRTFLPTDNFIKTSSTRFNHMNTFLTSNSFDKTIPTPPMSTSLYSSNLTPEISTKYEHVSSSTTHPPTTETHPLRRPTSFHYDQSSQIATHPFSSSSSTTIPSIDESISLIRKSEKSFPSPSSESSKISPVVSPTKIIYKPAVVFQAAPLPFSKNISQFAADEYTVELLSSPQKHVNRPETLIFQPDEDINSSCTKKSSSLVTPLLNSPTTHSQEKTKSKLPSSSEETATISVSSKPIETLEQTLNKYDTIIDQISSILASVSPLNSTMNDMSQGKNVLDCEPISDQLSIFTNTDIKLNSSPLESTTTMTTTTRSHTNGKYLIRGDSYDKIMATIADLDHELTPPLEYENIAAIVEQETQLSITSMLSKPSDDKTQSLSSSADTKAKATALASSNIDFLRHTSSTETSDEASSIKRNNKRVTWGDVTVNSDEESSLSQSSTDDVSSYETPFIPMKQGRLVTDQSTIIIQQDIDLPIFVVNVDMNNFTESTISTDQSTIVTTPIELLSPVIERRIVSSSSLDTSSSVSDSIDRQTTSSDINGFPSSQDEHINSSTSSDEAQFILPISYPSRMTSVTLPIIETSIDTPSTSMSTEYVRNDVDQSDCTPLIENSSNVDTTNRTMSLMASLRQTIVTPTIPLIETIQNVVSTMRTISALKPLQNEHDIKLTSTIVTDLKENSNQQEVSNENNLADQSLEESKTTLENIDDISTDELLVTKTSNSTKETNNSIVESASNNCHMNLSTKEAEKYLIDETETISSTSLYSHQMKIPETMEHLISTDQSTIPISTIEEISNDSTNASIYEISKILRPRSFDIDDKELVLNRDIVNTLSSIDDTNTSHNKSMMLENTVSFDLVIPTSQENNIVDDSISTLIDRKKEGILISDVGPLSEETVHINTVPNTSDILTSTSAEIQISSINTLDPSDLPFTPIQTVQGSLCSSQEKQQTRIVDEEWLLSTSRLSQVVDDKIAQSTTSHQSSDPLLQTDDVMAMDDTDKKTISASSTMTEFTFSSDTSDITAAAIHDNKMDYQTTGELTNHTDSTATSPLLKHLHQANHEFASSDSGLTQSTTTQIDEFITIEASNPLDHVDELSSTNTEPNSFELINVLRGHSIINDYSPDHIHYSQEKSPTTTTTSSQITSSDRYVSYAIHEMGESSQERLPSFPIEADIPMYEYANENRLSKPSNSSHQVKEDDSTEFDATDNFNSHSDNILFQKLQAAATKKQQNLDASSTDDDIDEELQQDDLTDLDEVIDKLTQPSSTVSINEEPYQRYELAATPSSNESSSSLKRTPEDVYYIPGYSGLWRPFDDDDDYEDIEVDYDADDERKTTPKIRRSTRISNSKKQHSSFANQSKSAIESENRVLNEGPPDPSESDSYQTCTSSLTKPIEKKSEETEHASSDENLFLIHQRERGVSLPVMMKIDCDDIAFRLSTSSPIDTHLHSINQVHSSSSIQSDPLIALKPISDNLASSHSLSSHESDHINHPSWLNTINTITTTTEEIVGPVESQIVLDKSAKGPINISECHAQGNYIIIKNTSRSKVIDLTGWRIYQENEKGNQCIFTFPDHCLLKPNHSLKILSKTNQSEQRNDDLIAHCLSSWQTGLHILTILINPEGKDCATLTKKTLLS